jgi:hypothetical protein
VAEGGAPQRHSDDTIYYLDLRTGEATATEAPEGTIYAGALNGITDLFWAREQDILVLHDAAADVWYLQDSPCMTLGGIGLGVGAQLAPHGGAAYWIGRTPRAKGGAFELAYDRMSFHIPG